jgi:hypothetical protein
MALDVITHDLAELKNLGIGDPVENVEAFLASIDEAVGAQHLEVLRGIGLTETRMLHQLTHGQLTVPHHVHELEAGRFRKDAEPFSDQPQKLGGQGCGFHGAPFVIQYIDTWQYSEPNEVVNRLDQ